MTATGAPAVATTEPCLAVENLSVSFGSLRVLDGVSLSVESGTRCAIIGPNGAGKSTMFNAICGEVRATAGMVRFLGRDITNLPPRQRAAAGLARTFQTSTLFPRLRVADNLILALQARTRTRFQPFVPRDRYRAFALRAGELLDRVGLADRADWPLGSLGHGEQRQVEILLALAQEPKLLLLDEPTAGLAPGDTFLVTELLKNYRDDVTMVLIEHDMQVVFEVVERIVVLNQGRVAAEGTVAEVRANPAVQEIYLGGMVEETADAGLNRPTEQEGRP